MDLGHPGVSQRRFDFEALEFVPDIVWDVMRLSGRRQRAAIVPSDLSVHAVVSVASLSRLDFNPLGRCCVPDTAPSDCWVLINVR